MLPHFDGAMENVFFDAQIRDAVSRNDKRSFRTRFGTVRTNSSRYGPVTSDKLLITQHFDSNSHSYAKPIKR
jgi:hypothetical protein